MANQKVPDKKPFRFSLRKLLLFMTICAVTCAVLVKLLEMPLVLGGAVGLVVTMVTTSIPFLFLRYASSERQLSLACFSHLLGFMFLSGLAALVVGYVRGSAGMSFSRDVIALEVVLWLGAAFCLYRAFAIALSKKRSHAGREDAQRQ